jgi:hypothetical protein
MLEKGKSNKQRKVQVFEIRVGADRSSNGTIELIQTDIAIEKKEKMNENKHGENVVDD